MFSDEAQSSQTIFILNVKVQDLPVEKNAHTILSSVGKSIIGLFKAPSRPEVVVFNSTKTIEGRLGKDESGTLAMTGLVGRIEEQFKERGFKPQREVWLVFRTIQVVLMLSIALIAQIFLIVAVHRSIRMTCIYHYV